MSDSSSEENDPHFFDHSQSLISVSQKSILEVEYEDMGNKLIKFVKKNLIWDLCWLTVSVYIGLKLGVQEGISFERQEFDSKKVIIWAQMASA